MSTIRAAIRRGIEEFGLEDDLANRIGDAKGWARNIRHRRIRLRQSLSDGHDRNFDERWVLLAIALFVDAGATEHADTIVGAVNHARYAAGQGAKPESERPRIHRVEPRDRRGREIA